MRKQNSLTDILMQHISKNANITNLQIYLCLQQAWQLLNIVLKE